MNNLIWMQQHRKLFQARQLVFFLLPLVVKAVAEQRYAASKELSILFVP